MFEPCIQTFKPCVHKYIIDHHLNESDGVSVDGCWNGGTRFPRASQKTHTGKLVRWKLLLVRHATCTTSNSIQSDCPNNGYMIAKLKKLEQNKFRDTTMCFITVVPVLCVHIEYGML
jgi:hypothetical protein